MLEQAQKNPGVVQEKQAELKKAKKVAKNDMPLKILIHIDIIEIQ